MNKPRLARIISEISNGFLNYGFNPIVWDFLTSIELFQGELIIGISPCHYSPPFWYLKWARYRTEFTDRRERPPYFISVSMLYGVLSLIIYGFQIPFLSEITLALFLTSATISFITLFGRLVAIWHTLFSFLHFSISFFTIFLPFCFCSPPLWVVKNCIEKTYSVTGNRWNSHWHFNLRSHLLGILIE